LNERIQQRSTVSLIALSGFVIAIVAALLAAIAGFGSRWDLWHFGTGFSVLRWAVYAAVAAALLSLSGTVVCRPGNGKRGLLIAFWGILISAPVIGVPISWRNTARTVPAIHDITTDVINPPQFVEILPLRADASNSVQYGGATIAAKQQAAYPDIQPVILNNAPAMTFDAALNAARHLGWKIVATDPGQGRIEASDTTFWFGFTDDIVIRIVPMGSGSRLDIRSVSRVGRSDVGTNAARIRSFMKIFNRLVKSS